MASTNPTAITDQEIDQLRDEVRAVLDAQSISKRIAAREAGVKESTFSLWLSGKYTGDNAKPAQAVEKWLESRAARERTLRTMPVEPGFQETRTAQEILSALEFTQAVADICVISGGAGVGKTTTCEEYQRTHPNVWIATMEPSTASVHGMLTELCNVMRVSEMSAAKLSRAIGQKIRGTDGLIIVDEAQHLSTAALEQLRAFPDKYGVGLALVGNETVHARIEGGKREPQFAQLFSRVGMRMTRSNPLAQDINMLITAWGVKDKDEEKLLRLIARKPSALRGMTKCLKLATVIANGQGAERSAEHISMAWARISPNDFKAAA